MKITCDRIELIDALTLANNVVPAKTVRPVLMNALVEATPLGLALVASDLDVSVRAPVAAADVERPGKALLNVKRALAVLRESDVAKVSLSSDGGETVKLTRGGGTYTIDASSPVADFPPLEGLVEAPEDAPRVSVDLLREMINGTFFASEPAGTVGSRFALQGLFLDWNDERMRFVGSDGKQIAVMTRTDTPRPQKPIRALIRSKAIQLLNTITEQSAEPIAIRVDERAFYASSRVATFSALLSEGVFPEYENFLPKDFTKPVEVNREAFAAALRGVVIVAAQLEKSKAVRLRFEPGQAVLMGREPGAGDGREVVPLPWAHEPMELVVNPAWIGGALKAMRSEKARFTFKPIDVTMGAHATASATGIAIDDGADFQFMCATLVGV